MFDSLGWDSDQEPIRVTCPVVVGWGVNIDLIPARVDGGVRLGRAASEHALLAMFVENEVFVVVAVPHLEYETESLFMKDFRIECIVCWGRGQRDVKRGYVAVVAWTLLVVLVGAGPVRLLGLDEVGFVDLQPHRFFSLVVMKEDLV